MNGSKRPVRLKVLYDHTGEPSHLVWRIKPKDGVIHTRCGLGYAKNFLGRGRVKLLNLRTNRLCCPKCQEFADSIITEADDHNQGSLYEE